MIVKKTVRRLTHPTEDGAWVEVRLPLSAGDLAGMHSDGQIVGMTLDLLASVIVAWSAEEPIDLASVSALDIDTFTWLTKEIMAGSNIRDDSEKKGSASSSSPTSGPDGEPSPLSSGI